MNLHFEYALFSPSANGYYTGEAGDGWIGKTPFTYTEAGAHRKAEMFNRGAVCVRDWVVVRYH